jgi:dTDP-4-amino-4,6-dideoxygalactose transaminase
VRLARAPGLELPVEAPGCESVYHLYVVRSEGRDALRSHLTERGIQTGLHYPVPVPLQPAYAALGHREGSFPESEAWARECLSLPMFAELHPAQLDEVIQGVKSFGYSRAPQANKALTTQH